MSHFRIDGGGNHIWWPTAGLSIGDRKGNISISHGLLTNNGYNGIRVYSMDGTSTDSAYITLSNILVDGAGSNGLEIYDNYYTVLRVEHVQVTDAYFQGIYPRNNYNSDIDLKSVYVTNCGETGFYSYGNTNSTTIDVVLSNFKHNTQRYTYNGEIYINDPPSAITFNNNNIINNVADYLVRSNYYGFGEDVDFTSNYWGSSVTNEMDSLGARTNISRI